MSNTERNKALERAMELAQEFASSWAFFGGPFDHGDGAQRAEEAKEELRQFLQSAIASPVAQPQHKKFELTPEMKAALEEANKTGALHALLPNGDVMFINRGEQPEDTADLDCPHCGGSGHKDDIRPVAQPQDERLPIFKAVDIVHEEAGRTLSHTDFEMCMRIAKRCLAATSQDAVIDVLRAERDHARTLYENAIQILTDIHALLYPPVTKGADGEFYMFNSPHVHEQMQALSDQIRAIPDKIAAMQAQGANNG